MSTVVLYRGVHKQYLKRSSLFMFRYTAMTCITQFAITGLLYELPISTGTNEMSCRPSKVYTK